MSQGFESLSISAGVMDPVEISKKSAAEAAAEVAITEGSQKDDEKPNNANLLQKSPAKVRR